jgi:hypothetical protein
LLPLFVLGLQVDAKYSFFYGKQKLMEIQNDEHARAAASYAAKGMTCQGLVIDIRRRGLAVDYLLSGAYTALLQNVNICEIRYVPSARILKV